MTSSPKVAAYTPKHSQFLYLSLFFLFPLHLALCNIFIYLSLPLNKVRDYYCIQIQYYKGLAYSANCSVLKSNSKSYVYKCIYIYTNIKCTIARMLSSAL
jgi:hypothetical protein